MNEQHASAVATSDGHPRVDVEFTSEPLSPSEMVVLAELLLGLRKSGSATTAGGEE